MTSTSSVSPDSAHVGGGVPLAKLARGAVPFAELNAAMNETFQRRAVGNAKKDLFLTETADLGAVWLSGFDEQGAAHHNCPCCLQFLRRLGSMVVLESDGRQRSALWDEAIVPDYYARSVRALRLAVQDAPITGVFISSDSRWGDLHKGGWDHLSILPPREMIWSSRAVLSADQRAAERLETFGTLQRSVTSCRVEDVRQAVHLLKTGGLFNANAVLPMAESFLELKERYEWTSDATYKSRILWHHAAWAPPGFGNPRQGMVGTLLDMVKEGRTPDQIKRSFDKNMDPLNRMRPKAAPTAGAVDAAERLFETLKLAPALERRYARLDDLQLLWSPRATAKAEVGGVFGRVRPEPKSVAPAASTSVATRITWTKFARTVLPEARKIELKVENGPAFIGLTTAVHPDAPPLLHWDREDQRNPVAWYFMGNGASHIASNWGLRIGTFAEVLGVTLSPDLWNNAPVLNKTERAIFLVRGARDTRSSHELCIFPACVRSELHGVRSVIERYSRTGRLDPNSREDAVAGVSVGDTSSPSPATFRVETTLGSALYTIDRWD